MIYMAVHSAIGAEAQQVQGAAIGQQIISQLLESGVAVDAAIFDRLANAHQLLADYAARTNREVTHLGIAHLVVGQAD